MFIADSILERVAQGEKLSSFAVLYRTNAQSGALESAFTKARIPYRVFGGLRFYERKEIKDIVAYLSLIANPADDMRLTRIINVPKRAIGTATVENVARIAAAEGAPMLEIVRNASDYPALLKASLKLERFYALIADLAEFAAEHSLSALVEEVLARTGYLDMLRSSPEDRDKEEIVQEFVSTAKLFEGNRRVGWPVRLSGGHRARLGHRYIRRKRRGRQSDDRPQRQGAGVPVCVPPRV